MLCLHIVCQVRLTNPYNFIYFLESRTGQELLRLTMKLSVKIAHYLRTTLMFWFSGNFPNELTLLAWRQQIIWTTQ